MKKPNFFIVGAPKCGTTALYTYLQQHPGIFLPEEKEPHFFGSDFQITNRLIQTQEEYLALFTEAKDETRLGEASVWYLYSKNAPDEIKKFCPWAKIIIMLRNPVDMLYSLHSNLLHVGYEEVEDFKTALEVMEKRRQGRCIPGAVNVIQGLSYRDVVKYTQNVQRYLDVFNQDNVHIILFDDFKKDTAEAYCKTLHFLGVDEKFKANFKVINPRQTVRSRALQKIMNKLLSSPTYQQLSTMAPEALKTIGRKLRWLIYDINTVRGEPYSPMAPTLRKRLQAEFLPEMEQLSQLLDRDLSHWSSD